MMNRPLQSVENDSSVNVFEDKRSFFEALARKYPEEMRLLFQGGRLVSRDKWRNVAEHCLVQTAAAEELSQLLCLPADEAEAMCSTAAIHDWRKRWERTGEAMPAKTDQLLKDVHAREDLLEATNPDYLARAYIGEITFTPAQELQFYLDVITRENDIVRSEDRLSEVQHSPRSVGLAEKANGQYWDKTRELRDQVEQRLFEQLRSTGHDIASPADIPLFIKSRIEEKWNAPHDQH